MKTKSNIFINNWTSLIILSLFSVATFVGCGGGGGGGGDSAGTPTVKQGTFLDSAVEGLSYVSGGQSGITDANGTFSFEEGKTVQFSIGDIVVGEAQGDTVITPVELVDGAEDETHDTVTNIIRFLQSLDENGNLNDGIQISETVRTLAQGKTISFEKHVNEFEDDVNTQDILTEFTGTSSLVSVNSARTHFGGTLLKTLAGTYSGTFSGDDSGTWTLTFDESGIFTGGSGNSADSGAFTLSGGGSASTNGSFDIGGSVSTGATFTGNITRSGQVSGTWKNDLFGDVGTFTGSKQ